MATIKNPKVILNPQAINVDAKIQDLQLALADGLPWLSRSFGRSWKMFDKQQDGKTFIFPAVYAGSKEYFDCMPNDAVNAHSFFSHRDKAIPATDVNGLEPYLPGIQNEWIHKVDIIFWFNQDKTHPGIDYPITENIFAEVNAIIRQHPYFRPTGIFYDADNIFDGYSLKHVEQQYVVFPYGGFRIEGEIQYLETDVFGQCD